jgi:hypothetical protein
LLALVVSTYKAFEVQMNAATAGATVGHAANGTFTAGYSGRTARKRRIAERLAQLVAEFDPSPAQKQLLAIIAGHLDDAERCQTAIARTRATNAARRLLKDIPRKPGPFAPRSPAATDFERELWANLQRDDNTKR